jgi:hypothetical protein
MYYQCKCDYVILYVIKLALTSDGEIRPISGKGEGIFTTTKFSQK